MARFLTLDTLSVKNKTALVRADLNLPMKDGVISDITRLTRFLPTLTALKNAGAKIVIISHFGRPEGQRDEKYSLRPIAKTLGNLLGEPVAFADDCVGEVAQTAVAALAPGGVLVLENTRFHPEEEANDKGFAQKLAALGDIYVNDAFSAAHRAHASTEALAYLLPAAAGKLMQEELEILEKTLEKPRRPLGAVIGGSKVSSKLALLRNLVQKVNMLVLGGGMANTFLAAQGKEIGKSLYEDGMLTTAHEIMDLAKAQKCLLLLPQDAVVAASPNDGANAQTVLVSDIPENAMILDIGPASIYDIRSHLATCAAILWNGPLGVFETPPFDKGTTAIAQAVAELTTETNILSVAGGGDTIAALSRAGVLREFSYVSTAGGAFLEWLEGKELPGIAALKNAVSTREEGE